MTDNTMREAFDNWYNDDEFQRDARKYGIQEAARIAFCAGAEWQASRAALVAQEPRPKRTKENTIVEFTEAEYERDAAAIEQRGYVRGLEAAASAMEGAHPYMFSGSINDFRRNRDDAAKSIRALIKGSEQEKGGAA